MDRTTPTACDQRRYTEWKKSSLNSKAFGALLTSMFVLTLGAATLGATEAHAAPGVDRLQTDARRLPSPPFTLGDDNHPRVHVDVDRPQGLRARHGMVTNGIMTNGLSVNGLMANGLMANGLPVNGVDSEWASARFRKTTSSFDLTQVKSIQLRDGRTVTVR